MANQHRVVSVQFEGEPVPRYVWQRDGGIGTDFNFMAATLFKFGDSADNDAIEKLRTVANEHWASKGTISVVTVEIPDEASP